MPKLTLYNDYFREQIHDIFAPETPFTRGSGTWGNWGILAIPERPNDFVFFVSYGRRMSGHAFEESITRDGVINWQSQPGQNTDNEQIKQLINHDELRNTVYLFLRTQTRSSIPYTYLGTLKYLTHDPQSGEGSSPVDFQWQILDWEITDDVLTRMGLVLGQDTNERGNLNREVTPGETIVTRPPPPRNTGSGSGQFTGVRVGHTPERDAANKRLGTAGEKWVVEYEKRNLIEAGRPELARDVVHVADVEGDGAGYDVRSYNTDGSFKHIEVKTTRGAYNSSFYISRREVAFSEESPNTFYLYRLYNFSAFPPSMYILHGNMTEALQLDPVNYRASVR